MSKNLNEDIKKIIKKEYIKSKLKSIIAENVKLLIETKMKVIRLKFEELLSQNKITDDEYNLLFKKDKSPSGPFKHKIFAEMVYQTLMAEENHMLSELVSSFPMFKNKIVDPYNRNQLKDPRLPGTSADTFPILELIQNDSLTFDKYNEYLNTLNQTDARSEVLQKLLDNGFQGNKDHFEVIYEGSDWIIVYPKTYLGSIATARMGPDRKYYTPPDIIGKMNWCTSVDSANNMFLNYHRKMNLHMYYFTKQQGFSDSDRNRKLCISILKQGGSVDITFGSASVDGNNDSFKNIKEVLNVIGDQHYSTISKDAQHPNRPEIDIESYYGSVSASQYQSLRKAAGLDEGNFEFFAREIEYYCLYNNNKEVLDLIFNDTHPAIIKAASYYYHHVKDTSGKYAETMVNNVLYSNDMDKISFNTIVRRLVRYQNDLEIPNEKIKEIFNHQYMNNDLMSDVLVYAKNILPEDINKHVFYGSMTNSEKSRILLSLIQKNKVTSETLMRATKSQYVEGYVYQYVLENNAVNDDIIKHFCSSPPANISTLVMLVKHKKMTQENFDLLWYSWVHNIPFVERIPGLVAKMNKGTWHPSKRSAAHIDEFSKPFLLAVIRSPLVTDDIAYDIIEEKYLEKNDLFEYLASNKNISEHLTGVIINFAFKLNTKYKTASHFIISKISKNTTSEKYIRFLYKSYEEKSKNSNDRSIFREDESPILFGLLENPSTPQDILKSIISKEDTYYHYPVRLARNTSAPPLFLARCLKNYKKDKFAARAAAQNTSTPLISLLKFAKEDYPSASKKAFFTAIKAKGLSIEDYPNDYHLPKLCADLGIDYEKL